MHIDVGHTPSFRISLKIKGGVNMTEADAVKIKNEEFSNIILYSAAMLISMVGTSIYTFAIGLYVLKITGSGFTFAINLVLGVLPMVIINPFAGVIADRLNRKKVVIAMDFLNGMLLILVYILSLFRGLSLPLIYSSTFMLTVFTTIFGINLEASIPNIVTGKNLLKINSLGRILDSSTSILGPMLGGIVYAFIDIKFFILINAVSFIISSIMELFMNFNVNCSINSSKVKAANIYTDIKEGLAYMIKERNILNIFLILTLVNFFFAFSISIPLPFIVNNVLKLGSKNYGIIQSSIPAGVIIGAFFIKNIYEKTSFKKIISVSGLFISICAVIIGLPEVLRIPNSTSLYIYIAAAASIGIMISFVDIPLSINLQKTIPDEYRGRVLSLGLSAAKIASPAALIISGIIINKIPAYIVPAAGGAVFFIIDIIMSLKNNTLKFKNVN